MRKARCRILNAVSNSASSASYYSAGISRCRLALSTPKVINQTRPKPAEHLHGICGSAPGHWSSPPPRFSSRPLQRIASDQYFPTQFCDCTPARIPAAAGPGAGLCRRHVLCIAKRLILVRKVFALDAQTQTTRGIRLRLIYYAHSYRTVDDDVNAFFQELMVDEQLTPSMDPPSDQLNAAKPERQLRSTDARVVVLTQRDPAPSEYIRWEIGLGLRARRPQLVFVEDTLPDDLEPSRLLQRLSASFVAGGPP